MYQQDLASIVEGVVGAAAQEQLVQEAHLHRRSQVTLDAVS